MELKTVTILARTVQVSALCTFEPKTVDLLEIQHTYAPTLATVTDWLFSEWGPFHISWRDGELCPFHPGVGRQNFTCSNGLRLSARCGLVITQQDVRHLSGKLRSRLVSRVACWEWEHRLIDAYWDIPDSDLLVLPDSPSYVAFMVLRYVYRVTGWARWIREKRARKGKLRSLWFKGLNPCLVG